MEIYRRLAELERVVPRDMVILIENGEGDQREIFVADFLNDNGETKPGFEGFEFVRVVQGNKLKDVDKVLKHITGGECVICRETPENAENGGK